MLHAIWAFEKVGTAALKWISIAYLKRCSAEKQIWGFEKVYRRPKQLLLLKKAIPSIREITNLRSELRTVEAFGIRIAGLADVDKRELCTASHVGRRL